MSAKIRTIHAHEILDSRATPTLNVTVLLADGSLGSASVPSGASTGKHEALELRDGDKKRFGGKGVLRACRNVNGPIAAALRRMDARRQRDLDARMLELDGTENKRKLGANAILGVSLAAARAAAVSEGLPLYGYLRDTFSLKINGYKMPVPMMNFVNGGLHADTDLDIQEIMFIPFGIKSVRERIRAGAEVFHALGKMLVQSNLDSDVGNEGGYAPDWGSRERALDFVTAAIKKSGYKPGKDAGIGLDAAASELYSEKTQKYILKTDKKKLSSEALSALYGKWIKKYPMISIEDPFAEDAWRDWKKFTASFGKKIWIVGDDLFVTNVKRLKEGIAQKAGNAILIKPNQIGSLSETIDAILLAQKNRYRVIVSHRSGETCDTAIADISVALGADAIKTGSVARSERTAKYNRLLEIEEETA